MNYTEAVKQLAEEAQTQTPMPRYQCHKKVWALKIAAIEVIRPTTADLEAVLKSGDDDTAQEPLGAVITPADHGYGRFGVPKSFMDKHNPQVGGYFVVYDDGYQSFSPAKAFEEGYTRL